MSVLRSFAGVGLFGTLVACGSGGGFPDAPPIDAPAPNGAFAVAWTVQDTNAAAVPCGAIGAQSVTVILRDRAKQGGFTEVFTCGSASGTASVPPGSYDLEFELQAPSGLLAKATAQMAVDIRSNQTTQLTPLVFSVNATGALELTLATNTSGGNCAPTGSNGAGITSTTITLEDSSMVCEPVTFNVSAGASGTAGTYVVNCASPAVAGCFNSDQKLTVTGVPSGAYKIRVRGSVGGTACWTNSDNLTVPPLGATNTRVLNLAMSAGACP